MVMLKAQNLFVKNRLKEVSLSLSGGQMLGVIGPNGSGKSTLLQSLAGILPAKGSIEFMGKPLFALPSEKRAQKIGFLPQFCDSAWPLLAYEIVALGRLPWHDRDEAFIQKAMRETDTENLAQKPVNQLSGGEQARVWLARVLAADPLLILADEPIANLDFFYQAKIMESLSRHAQGKGSVIVSLHDLSIAARYCDRICLIHQGGIRAFGLPEEVLTEKILSEVFGLPVRVNLQHKPPLILPS